MSETGFTTENDTRGNIERLLGRFMSPDFSKFLSAIIQGSVGDVFKSHLGTMPYGPNAIFGPQSAGPNIVSAMNQQTMNQVMQPTEQILQTWQRDQNIALHKWMGASDAQARGRAGDPLNVTNWASWFLLQQAQPQQLQAGLEVAGRYMGAGAPMGLRGPLANQQDTINAEVQNINAGIMMDYRNNFAQYGGLAGKDVGRIVAESARTGAIGTGMGQDAINQVIRDNANAAAVSQRFFSGTVLQRLDQMNALLGVNATATLGGTTLSAMQRDWSATSLVTGYKPMEMRLFGEASAQVYRHFGVSSLGAMSTGNIAAYLTSTGMTGGSSAFVNERRFREGVISRTAGAQASSLARVIAGAQVLVGEAEEGNVAGFKKALMGGGYLSPGGVLETARQFGYQGGLGDIVSAGFTREADVIRARGDATLPVLMSNLEQVTSVQRGQVMNVLMNRGMTAAQARGAVGRVGGAFTLSNISRQMIPGMEGGTAIMGDITNLFNQSASALGFGTAEEVDKLKAAATSERLSLSMGRGADAASIDALTAGRGQMSGLLGIQAMLNIKGGAAASGFKALWGAVTGNMDIESMAALRGSTKALVDIEDSQLEARATAGYDVVAMAVSTGWHKGKLLTPETRKPLQDLMLKRGRYKEGGGWAEALAEYATPEEARKWRIRVNTRDIMKKAKGKNLTEGEVKNEATAMAQLQIYQSIPGKEDGFTAEAIRELAGGAELSEVMGALQKREPEEFEKWRTELREAMSSNERLEGFGGRLGGGTGTGPFGAVFDLLQTIVDKLQDGIGVNILREVP